MNDADYFDALEEIRALVRDDPAPDTPAGRRLATLAADVDAFERERFPFVAPTPAVLAAFRRREGAS